MFNSTEQQFHIIAKGDTDRGLRREHNEDSYTIFTTMVSSLGDPSNRVQARVAVVADGIGGAEGGKEASRIAVETIEEQIHAHALTSPISNLLNSAILCANDKINDIRKKDVKLQNMGTTVVVAIIVDDRLYISHVGDSRAYLIRQDKIYRLTLDHTWVQEAIEAGQLTAQEAAIHPNKNVVKRYLGSNDALVVDSQIIDFTQARAANDVRQMLQEQRLQPGDVVMLCTDGLTDLVKDEEIKTFVRKYKNNLAEAVKQLINLANKKGGFDNITVAIMAWEDESKIAFPASLLQTRGSRGLIMGLLLLVGVAIFWSMSANQNPIAVVDSTQTTFPQNNATSQAGVGSATSTRITGTPRLTASASNTLNPVATSTAVSTFTPISSVTTEQQISSSEATPTIDLEPTTSESTESAVVVQPSPTWTPSSAIQNSQANPTSTPLPTIPVLPTEISVPVPSPSLPQPTTLSTSTLIVSTNTPFVPTNTPFVPTNTPFVPTNTPYVPTNTPVPVQRNVGMSLLSPRQRETIRANEVQFRVQVNGMEDGDRLLLRASLDQQTWSNEENLFWNGEGGGTYWANMNYQPNNAGFGKVYYWQVVAIDVNGTELNSSEIRQFRWDDPSSGDSSGGSGGTSSGP